MEQAAAIAPAQLNRRLVLVGCAAFAAGVALPALAQQAGRVYRVGVLFGGHDGVDAYRDAVAQRLATHGFVEGRNLVIDARAAATDPQGALERLLAARPDALLTWSTYATATAVRAAPGIPVVFSWVADPVGAGFVGGYARPGGDVTGVSNRYGDMLVKRLELAIELVPGVRRVALLNAEPRLYGRLLAPALRRAAADKGVALLEISSSLYSGAWKEMIEQAARDGAGAALTHYHFAAYSGAHGREAIASAHANRLPVVFVGAEMVEAGGLIAYGVRLADDARRAGDQVARILKGAKPADIPVDQAMRFELAVNLKTARTMGLEIPQSILLRADRVIE